MPNYAIVIGINDYTPPQRYGLQTLHGAIPDAQAVADWLVNNNKVPAANCMLITSTVNPLSPIKNVIDTAIANMVQNIVINGGNAGRLYFYFAGHGMGVQADLQNNGLCMADWSEFMTDAATLSSDAYKRKFLSEGLFDEIVIWLDCCRNTKLFLNPQGGPGIIPNLGPNANPKVFIGYATQYQNQAFEAAAGTGNEKRGIFTSVLLRGLGGGDASQGGSSIDADALRNYLYYNVPLKAQQAGFVQYPEVYHNTGGGRQLLF